MTWEHREDCKRGKSELGRKEKKEVRHGMGKSRKWEEKELVWWDVGDPEDDGEEREITSVPHWFLAFLQPAFWRRLFLREALVSSALVIDRPAFYCSCTDSGRTASLPGLQSPPWNSGLTCCGSLRCCWHSLDHISHSYTLKPSLWNGWMGENGKVVFQGWFGKLFWLLGSVIRLPMFQDM